MDDMLFNARFKYCTDFKRLMFSKTETKTNEREEGERRKKKLTM